MRFHAEVSAQGGGPRRDLGVVSERKPWAAPSAFRQNRLRRIAALSVCALLLGGCEGAHSMLEGAGTGAAAVERLFWVMLAAAAVIWAGVMALAFHAARIKAQPEREDTAEKFVLLGGVVFPTVTLIALLVAGMLLLRGMIGGEPDLHVAVEGEQWWWRVDYRTPDGDVSTANEIRLPLGQTVELSLTSTDVIHSFWAPALGGKMDMIPGRTTTLKLTPVEAGRWGGVCAEFCGIAHAQMRFEIVVLPPEEFAAWLAAEARPAAPAASADGQQVFLSAGCGACHAVRGTPAAGTAGPDLTHLAARATIASGIVPLTRDQLRAWIDDPDAVKPGALMPAFPDLAPAQMEALLDYLTGLT